MLTIRAFHFQPRIMEIDHINFSHFLEQDGGNMSYFVHGFYMGIVPLFVLSGCLLVGREQKPIRFWLTVFGVGVFFALGKFNPLYSLFHEWVPVFNLFRFPQKFFFFCAYALVFLSAWGLDRFVTVVTHEKTAMKKGDVKSDGKGDEKRRWKKR